MEGEIWINMVLIPDRCITDIWTDESKAMKEIDEEYENSIAYKLEQQDEIVEQMIRTQAINEKLQRDNQQQEEDQVEQAIELLPKLIQRTELQ
jgi:hypothetical protein